MNIWCSYGARATSRRIYNLWEERWPYAYISEATQYYWDPLTEYKESTRFRDHR